MFADYETGAESARPIELYSINYSGNSWNFTNAAYEITIGGVVYIPQPIKRGETTDTGDATKANLEVRMAFYAPLSDAFKTTPPSEPVTITILQYHEDPNGALLGVNSSLVWKGRVINMAWSAHELVLTTESVFSSLLRTGATRKFSRQCTHALYGAGCQADRQRFSVTAIAGGQSTNTISIAHGKPANYFAGGYITYRNAANGAIERRAIRENTETAITLATYPLGIQAGVTEITLYAGCDHTYATCKAKFDNLENYGGQPYIPIQNPFGGSTIY